RNFCRPRESYARSSLSGGEVMEPENKEPDADQPKTPDTSNPGSRPAQPAMDKQEAAPSKNAAPEVVPQPSKPLQLQPTRIVPPSMTQRKFRQVSRRELLKLAPVLA